MYKGGKNGNGTYQSIINQIPEHSIYFELFAGSAAVFRRKRTADISILCEKSRKQCENLNKIVSPADIVINCDVIANLSILLQLSQLFHNLGHEVFWYIDPPYPFKSRSYKKPIYKHELCDMDHVALLTGIRSFNFPVAISTYENSIYSNLLSDWRLITFQSIVRGGTRTEYLYMNYPKSSQLHDFSYIGDNFREREAFSRQRKNFLKKLNKMSPILKNAILSDITSNFL